MSSLSSSSNVYADDEPTSASATSAAPASATSAAPASATSAAPASATSAAEPAFESAPSTSSPTPSSSPGPSASDPASSESSTEISKAEPVPVTSIGEIPMSLTIAILVVLVVAAATGLQMPAFNSGGGFMISQMSLNFSLLILLSCLYGLACMIFGGEGDIAKSANPIVRFQHIFLPIMLIVALWLKCYLTYSSSIVAYCNAKNAQEGVQAESGYRWDIILWNTSKVPMAIFVTYIFVLMFPGTLTPFYQLFDSTHTLVFFFGVGFWTGCASWASEASCYFEILRYGCTPAENVDFKSIDATIEAAEAAEDDDD